MNRNREPVTIKPKLQVMKSSDLQPGEPRLSPSEITSDMERNLQERKQDVKVMDSRDSMVLQLLKEHDICRNLLTYSYEINCKELTDTHVNGLTVEARGRNPKITKQRVDEVLDSGQLPEYHPFDDYLTRLSRMPEAKGELQKLLDCIVLDGHDPEFKDRIIMKWFGGIMGTLAGSYSVMTFVLTGGQNTGKTRFFRGILPRELSRYFVESDLNNDRDVQVRMCNNLIIYDDEFTSKNKTEANVFKKMSSAEHFTLRPVWGKRDVTRKRTAVLAGSSNEHDVISDLTGNRRILATRIKEIDHEAFQSVNMDLVYRELYQLQVENPTWWHLTKEDIEFLNVETLHNTVVDEYAERVLKYTEPDENGFVSATEVQRHISGHDNSYHGNTHKLSRSLAQIYGKSENRKINGKTQRGYKIRLIS